MEHILVPVDFSSDSEKTLIVAATEARLKGAKVTLLHVIEIIASQDLELFPGIVPDDDSDRERVAKEELSKIRTRLFDGIQCEIVVKRCLGSVYSEIVSLTSDTPISLIVMSAHSRSFIEKLFLESTSNKVINSSRCPVLVVPV